MIMSQIKENLMNLEKENKELWLLRIERKSKYEEWVRDEMVNGAVSLNPKITFENFVETAIKDYSLFQNRLGEDSGKYLEKLYHDSCEFKLNDCSK